MLQSAPVFFDDFCKLQNFLSQVFWWISRHITHQHRVVSRGQKEGHARTGRGAVSEQSRRTSAQKLWEVFNPGPFSIAMLQVVYWRVTTCSSPVFFPQNKDFLWFHVGFRWFHVGFRWFHAGFSLTFKKRPICCPLFLITTLLGRTSRTTWAASASDPPGEEVGFDLNKGPVVHQAVIVRILIYRYLQKIWKNIICI